MRMSLIALVLFSGSLLVLCSAGQATAQPIATIPYTSTPINAADGVIDAAWAGVTEHSSANMGANWFTQGTVDDDPTSPGDRDADAVVSWRALWDDDNLYVLAEATDNQINNLTYTPNWATRDWEDDSFEVYIDATEQNVLYDTAADMIPAYQFTLVAGNDATLAEADREFFGKAGGANTSSFTQGTNSYANADGDTTYVQGSDTSSSTITSVDSNGENGSWFMEAAFPWTSLVGTTGETPDDIIARGNFGFSIAYNDDDETDAFIGPSEGRDGQFQWGTDQFDIWQNAANMPEVALEAKPTTGVDTEPDGDVDGTDFLALQRDDPSLIGDWKAAYPSPVAAVSGVPEPSTLALLAIGALACQQALIRRR